jgi:hypothetical protein
MQEEELACRRRSWEWEIQSALFNSMLFSLLGGASSFNPAGWPTCLNKRVVLFLWDEQGGGIFVVLLSMSLGWLIGLLALYASCYLLVSKVFF